MAASFPLPAGGGRQEPGMMNTVAVRAKGFDLGDLDQENHLPGVGLEERVGGFFIHEIPPDHIKTEHFPIKFFRPVQVRNLNHEMTEPVNERQGCSPMLKARTFASGPRSVKAWRLTLAATALQVSQRYRSRIGVASENSAERARLTPA